MLTAEQEKGVVAMLAAFQNGKRINELDAAKGALKDMRIEVMDETGETHSMELADAVSQASNPIAGRYWNTANGTPTAAGYYGSLQALRDLPKKLGLGRYLVTDDRKKRKLDPTDSTKYEDGSPAALDGAQGQCMWCWNDFIANIFTEGGNLVKCVTFDKPVGNGVSIRVPAGGTSWLGAGVMDRTNQKLCSVISDAEQYRGGGGSALKASSYSNAPAADAKQLTMLGMPATNISTTNFGTYARKRGEGWEANWFVAQFVVEFLFEVIMGTQNSQADYKAEKDANGLYQGGFGTGVTDMPNWDTYNGYYPVIPTAVGLEAGDGVCLVDYNLPNAEGGTFKSFKVPVFFGLMHAGYGSLWRWVRGLIMDAGEEKSEVYVSRSMFAAFDPSTVSDKIKVAECPRTSGWIKRKSYNGLCCMPTEVGASPTTNYCDQFYTDAATSKGLRVRAAGGSAVNGTNAGASYTGSDSAATTTRTFYSSPLCYFEEDPIIEQTA
ncbi:hypothetical protein [Prevotella merdae]|uniref:hypothetical protein n=1 Tax=Prevotella merdae TaxID=2079531 RepID=UPI0035614087